MGTETQSEWSDSTDRTIEAILHIQPIMHRKMHREVFFAALRQLGLGIGFHHIIIIATLKNFGRATSSEIGETTYISKAQMTHSTGKLILMGLIKGHPDPKDKRKTNFILTVEGHRVLDHMHEITVSLIKERLSTLPPDEVETLGRSLEKAAGIFMKL